MKNKKIKTYISLFSSAGIGCYGFQMEGFECIATNELIKRRLNIQRNNNKCKYESGYICGDITQNATKKELYAQIDLWKNKEDVSRVDVVIATPPCQGMSVANHKKGDNEIIRNSLIVESIKIIKQINPKFFIFENVPAFMKTICTDSDGENKSIEDAIKFNLGQKYSYTSKVINFKNYGACSSRQRTLVIGVSKDISDDISPFELYPEVVKERTLREVIGHLKPLKEFGAIDEEDIYHSFRVYPKHMREWIADIKEGESAFDNIEDNKKPHRIINGEFVINQQKNGDKYRRQYWDKVGPCVHTRNDQLASQNTVHPSDDRVFSIRELMVMLTVPSSFKWVAIDFDELNALPLDKKREFLKKEEINIRQSLGESVPTTIFRVIAKKIAEHLDYIPINTASINKIVTLYELRDTNNLGCFIKSNPLQLSPAYLGKIAEMANTSRIDNAAFFTSKTLITEMINAIPDFDKDTVRILEPSVGLGNFIPLIIKKFESKKIILDVVDIDQHILSIAEMLMNHYTIPQGCVINYINDDFLLHNFTEKYDLVIGNPPFVKMSSNDKLLKLYRNNVINKSTTNICSFFLEKALNIGKYVSFVFPKFLLNTPEFAPTREYLSNKAVECIIDFGEKGFPGVLVETLAIMINNQARPSQTRVISITYGKFMLQPQRYIFDKKLPYWIIYRNAQFDNLCEYMDFNVFSVFRDRQITNKLISSDGTIRVLKSRNISDDGKSIIKIDNYDAYISEENAKKLTVYKYIDNTDVFLTPNMTYNPRVIKKPMHCLVNGSIAILIPKGDISPTEKQLAFFASNEYRSFYRIARNYQTRSLNVDSCAVFFYGLLRTKPKKALLPAQVD